MSSYSFSHQFYQRWTLAPEPVRTAITQELKDITTLLQTETPFESFVFSIHDLDAHIDELYQNHEAEQAIAKAIADKQAQERAAAEQQRLAEEQKIAQEEARALAEAERVEAQRQAEKEQKEKLEKEKAEAIAQQEIEDASSPSVEANKNAKGAKDNTDSNNNNDNNQDVTAVADKPNDAVNPANHTKKEVALDIAPTNTVLSGDHEGLIHELGVHVDDYLSEQMMQMSEDLKSWLRAEVSRQLAGMVEKPQAVENTVQKNDAKQN